MDIDKTHSSTGRYGLGLMIGVLKSPAAPAAMLLYGLLFGFAAASYTSMPWLRSYTIVFYAVIMGWTAVIAVKRRAYQYKLNRVDLFAGAFLLIVLMSSALNWWHGTLQYISYMPFFFVTPLLLGRLMNDRDILTFSNVLLFFGGILYVLIPLEYAKAYVTQHVDSPNPYLFNQGHGVMLSGLLLSGAFLVLLSKILLYREGKQGRLGCSDRMRLVGLFAAWGGAILLISWIAARGAMVAASISMVVLLLFSSYRKIRWKVSILVVFALFALAAANNPFAYKYSKQYYLDLVQSPVVVLDKKARSEAIREGDIGGVWEKWNPILGEDACALVKDSISDRWVQYQTAFALFVSYPLTGVGANRYGHYSCSGPGWFPHSTILQAMAELGLLGALVYGLLIATAGCAVLKYYFRSDDVMTKAIAGWMLAYLVFQLISSQFYGNYFMSTALYFAIGVASRFAGDINARQAEV